ncbi:alpha/beta hydrolase [Spongiibacter nanhainus]|uniref:Alpha/beta hydrolase n=1 Tax=Spongiibacter nanhainus TaxID=2794344 RepID=A0A7T4USQ3_9GAMM|nr:alpha/beta hydrolase [Spongiibacter nanhainus]QQD19670.1 alpha/beta hydrolase [Spongiibacter nanhainus]
MLLLSLLWAAMAWLAYKPRSTSRWLGLTSFIFGYLVGELGLHLVAVQIALTLLVILFGELSGFSDALALAISVASWVAIGLFYFRAQAVEEIAKQAVDDVIGNSDTGECLTYQPDLQRLLNPLAFRKANVTVDRDVVYHEVNGRRLKLDIYRPADSPHAAPVLFQIHGGAWVVGNKHQQALPLLHQMAENGWICVSIQYRLSPAATFPDHIIDCKRALTWVKEHIRDFGGDPGFVIATGGSAGGHLSSLLALSANAPEFQPGFESADTTVQGCIPYYGVYDFNNRHGQYGSEALQDLVAEKVFKSSRSENQALWDQASPIDWVEADAPPFFIIHGSADTLVTVKEGRYFYDALKETSANSVGYLELPDAQHAFDLLVSLRNQHVVNQVCRYLKAQHQRYLAGK